MCMITENDVTENGHQGYDMCCYGRAPVQQSENFSSSTQRYVLTYSQPQWKVRIQFFDGGSY